MGKVLAFPNSILISCSKNSKILEITKAKDGQGIPVKINIPEQFCSFRVIDGQHRLLGLSKLNSTEQEEHYIPIIALNDIGQKQEVETFIEINSKQKKIDPNLLLLLKADFNWDIEENPKEYYQKIAVDFAKKLNTNSLKNMIYIPDAVEHPSRKGKIALATLSSTFTRNNFVGKKSIFKDKEEAYNSICASFQLLKKYLHNFANTPEDFFLSNQGLRVFFRLMQLYHLNKTKKNIAIEHENFILDLKSIVNTSLINQLKEFYGEGGANKATNAIIRKFKTLNKAVYLKFNNDLRKLG